MIIMIQYLKIPCSQQVAKSSAQKETKKKREKHSKKKITYRFQKERKKKKATQHKPRFSPASLWPPPHFPRHTALPCAFLKSPTCALHMLLPGASETKTVLCFTIIGIRRMCEHKASPTPALMWPVGDL